MAKQQSLLKNTPSTSTLTPHHSSVPVAATCILKSSSPWQGALSSSILEDLLRRGAG